MMETRPAGFSRAAARVAGLTTPLVSGSRRVTSKPRPASQRQVSSTEGCSMKELMILLRSGGRFTASPLRARLFASDPPPVKMILRAVVPRSRATLRLALSRRRFDCFPAS
jgi:hypothetical protein